MKELEEVEEALEAVSDERRSMKLEQEELDMLKQDVSEYTEVRRGQGSTTATKESNSNGRLSELILP